MQVSTPMGPRSVPGGDPRSSPVGTRPAFCAGSCPAARATASHSRTFWRARHPTLSVRQPGQPKTQYLRSGQVSWCLSRAAARACAETPKSQIAFPLTAGVARLQSTLAPLPRQSAQALRDRSPPARLFTQSGEVLGGWDALMLEGRREGSLHEGPYA